MKQTYLDQNYFFYTHTFNFSCIFATETLVVPYDSIYQLECWGAKGGGTEIAANGAYSKSFVNLTKGTSLTILVGEKGWDGVSSWIKSGGGGGGTFISQGTNPLCVAGGGGGNAHSVTSMSSFNFSFGQSTETGGDPGTGVSSIRGGGRSGLASGGGGFEGDGSSGSNYGKGGISFIHGGRRQTENTYGTNIAYGGFGGGASGYGRGGCAPGGGGYSGGSASNSNSIPGGGGGSFHTGSYLKETSISISGYDSSIPSNPRYPNGFAKITALVPPTTLQAVICFTRKGIPIYFTHSFSTVSFIFAIILH